MKEAREFLKALFEGLDNAGKESYILLWANPGRRSHWAKSAVGAANIAAKQKDVNLYVGCGLSPHNYGPAARCKAEDIIAIPALWADIDLAGGLHAKPNLPHPAEADAIIRQLPTPSIRVHSGYGLQLWWLFKEIWWFDQPNERREAAAMTAGWVSHIRGQLARRGYDADAVGDLARVMRLPGTRNLKDPANPRAVTAAYTDVRYNPIDFEEYAEAIPPAAIVTPAGLILSPDAQPPFDKFAALAENNPTFMASYSHARQIREFPDQSASAYDLSLASFALQAGWSPQEVVNLLIAHRRKHNIDLKLRADYYARTIQRAQGSITAAVAHERLAELAVEGAPPMNEDSDPTLNEAPRRERLKYASAVLGIGITRMLKFPLDPPIYRMITERGSIEIGRADSLLSQTIMRGRVLAATGIVTTPLKGKAWDNVVQALADACEEADPGTDFTAEAWLEDYLGETPPVVVDEKMTLSAVAAGELPFIQDGKVHVFGVAFRRWLTYRRDEKITSREMGMRLAIAGYKPKVIPIKSDSGRSSTRQVWVKNT